MLVVGEGERQERVAFGEQNNGVPELTLGAGPRPPPPPPIPLAREGLASPLLSLTPEHSPMVWKGVLRADCSTAATVGVRLYCAAVALGNETPRVRVDWAG